MANVQISIDDELLKRIDTFADNNYMSRSGLFTIAVNQYLNMNEVTSAIVRLNLAFEKIAENGNIDDKTMKELEDWQRLANLLSPRK